MRTINIDDFPEPWASAVEQMVENLRQQLKAKPKAGEHLKLKTRPGDVIGDLRRTGIYGERP